MVGNPFLAIVERERIEHISELLDTYENGDEIMIVPKEIYDRLMDDLAEMKIKFDKIKEVLDSKERYMREIDQKGVQKDKLFKIREILENPV